MLFPCVALGAATFIMQASESVISVAFNSSLLQYGGDLAVGAMTILSSVMQFAMLPLQGLGQGAQPIISYNYGAGKRDRVKKAYFLLLRASLFYSCLLWALVELFPQAFASLFTNDAELGGLHRPRPAPLCGSALPVRHPDGLSDGLHLAGQGQAVHPGGGHAQNSSCCLPLIYLMPMLFHDDQARAVYLAEPVADTLAVTFTSVLFFFSFRKVLRQMDQTS